MYKKIEEQLLPIVTSNSSLGIMVSGGFDSGLLLYTCLYIKRKYKFNTQIKVFVVPRHDDSVIHCKRIVNWINKIFDENIKILMTGDPDLHHSQQVWSGAVSASNHCDKLLLADTTNPQCLPNGPVRNRLIDNKIFQPFFDLTKKDTVSLAIELNLLELMTLSHTCTESKLLRCNTCWQCKERAWGFEQNNYSDPGTM